MRNRYLDTLRAVAIVRVVVYHHFGWAWLSLVFPAMGVMFAVAGSLTAASLDRRPAGAVVTSRVRRLLPPVWLLGLVTVPLMLRFGWAAETDGEHPFQPATLLFWVLPLGDPPGSQEAAFVWDALWYVRTYLWLVVLSPLLYPLYRRVGWPLLAAPLLGMALLERGDFGMPAQVESALWDLTTYGACWLAGFAHRDGRLARVRPAVTVAAAAALAGLGLYWLVQGHAETGWDLNEASEAQAVYSLAAVLLLLRWEPPARLLAHARLAGAVSVLNARAVTVYLWHGVAIAAVWPVLERAGLDDLGALEGPATLGAAVALTVVAVLAFGWAEDLAARRRPRLWPSPTAPGADTPAGPGTPPADRPGTDPTTRPGAGSPGTGPAIATTFPPSPRPAFGPSPRPAFVPLRGPTYEPAGRPSPKQAFGPAGTPSPGSAFGPAGTPSPEPAFGPVPAGWPETPHVGAHRAGDAPVTQRITPPRTRDMPVAGRPPEPVPDPYGGAPRAAPRQDGPDPGEPLPLRFTGSDGTP